MSVYHQIGHDSQNLVDEVHLGIYHGAILSPVNYEPSEIASQVANWAQRTNFDSVFDPQLYYPRTTRGCLRDWSYFPQDFDTADQSSPGWWTQIVDALAVTCNSIGVSSVCSPALVPGVFSDDYFSHSVQICNELVARLGGDSIEVLQTAIVGLPDLAVRGRALSIASILTQTQAERVYLVFQNTTAPRRELKNAEELKGAMRLVNLLESAGIRVLVGFCCSDVILWKAAGASSCASGKFFNLRRFTPSRWDDDQASGGGQVPYWFEESLLAFLRQGDLIRAARRNLLSVTSQNNPYGIQVLQQLATDPNLAWLKLSWCHFLYWFADIESRIGAETTDSTLLTAENNWLLPPPLLMEEPQNNGDWVRPWRIAVQDFVEH